MLGLEAGVRLERPRSHCWHQGQLQRQSRAMRDLRALLQGAARMSDKLVAMTFEEASRWITSQEEMIDRLTSDKARLAAELALQKESLVWVLDNFNTFKQPPDRLKHIIDASCLKAMTADEDAVILTSETFAEPARSDPDFADWKGPWCKACGAPIVTIPGFAPGCICNCPTPAETFVVKEGK